METFYREPDYPLRFGLITLHVVFVASVIYGCNFGFYLISWVLAILFTIGGGLGVTLMYHRMLTHKSFECGNFYVRRTLIYFGGLLQNATSWVANHWSHHAYTDTDDDPHSPRSPYHGGIKGFWWSHIGWLGWKYCPPERFRNHPDLQNPDIVWEDKWHILFVISGFLIPFLIGGIWGVFGAGLAGFFLYGLDAFLLAGIIRTVVSLHITLSINSFGHMVGWHARTPEDKLFTTDSSRDNPLLALISGGEGNHGAHHKYPGSARIGFLDPSWLVILIFEKLGIFTNVKRPLQT